MDIRDFKKMIFEKAKRYGFSDYEIYYVAGSGFSVRVFDGEISEYKNAVSKGLSFRGTYKGKIGYSFTERIDESVIDFLIENAAQNAEIIEDKDVEKLYKGDDSYQQVNTYNCELDNISVESKIEKAILLEKATRALDQRIKAVDHCGIGSQTGEIYLTNSLGLEQSSKSNMAYIYSYPRAVENDSTKVSGISVYSRDFNELDANETAKKSVDKAISYLNASSAPSGVYSVLFDNESFISLLYGFMQIFYAENVQKGFSLLKDKLNTEISSKIFTLRDDGVYNKSLCSVTFDSEGVATKNKAIIENGILKNYLYNSKSAEKDGVQSTGNGFKPSFRSSVTTGPTNLYVQPSDVPIEDLMTKANNGFLISSLQGLHSGINAVSGDFSLSAMGHMLDSGKIVKAVEQITIAGNFYKLINDVIGVGNDLKFDYNGFEGAVGSPAVLIRELNISGI